MNEKVLTVCVLIIAVVASAVFYLRRPRFLGLVYRHSSPVWSQFVKDTPIGIISVESFPDRRRRFRILGTDGKWYEFKVE